MESTLFNDKIVLITGVSGGIGLTILNNYFPKVKTIISSSRNNFESFWEIEKEIPENLTHYPMDLTVEDNVKTLFENIIEKHGRLDILINTIGGSLFSHKIEDFPIDEYDQVMAVNLRTAFLLTKEAIKTMKSNEKSGGNIIHFVSSSVGKISNKKAPYGIAKAGLTRLIKYAAVESAEYNIKINGISPTYVFTERHLDDIEKKRKSTEKPKSEIIKKILSSQTLKKELYPEDMIPVVDLLSTTEVITGQVYNVSMGELIN
jgi:NAD(P)-dependent dehydrogenase (short-subunit alcohol dehydrogenase family)